MEEKIVNTSEGIMSDVLNHINTIIPSLPNYRPLKPITIGEIPSVYYDSLTYAEQLLEIVKYLQNIVIPYINKVVETTNENIDILNENLENWSNDINNLITEIETFKANLQREWEEFQNTITATLTEYEDKYNAFETRITTEFNNFKNNIKTIVNNYTNKTNKMESYLNFGYNTPTRLTSTPISWNGKEFKNIFIELNSGFLSDEIGYLEYKWDNEVYNGPYLKSYNLGDNYIYYTFGQNLNNYQPIFRVNDISIEMAYIIPPITLEKVTQTSPWTPVQDTEYGQMVITSNYPNGKYMVHDTPHIYVPATYKLSDPNNEYNYIIDTNNGVASNVYYFFSKILNRMEEIIETGKIDVTADFTPQFNELKSNISNLQTNINNVENTLNEHITNADNTQSNNQTILDTHTTQITQINNTINDDLKPLINEVSLLKNKIKKYTKNLSLTNTYVEGTINDKSVSQYRLWTDGSIEGVVLQDNEYIIGCSLLHDNKTYTNKTNIILNSKSQIYFFSNEPIVECEKTRNNNISYSVQLENVLNEMSSNATIIIYTCIID